MRFVTISGPPSSGKTSVVLKAMEELKDRCYRVAVIKFDCLATDDDKRYEAQDIDSRVGLSGRPIRKELYCMSTGLRVRGPGNWRR